MKKSLLLALVCSLGMTAHATTEETQPTPTASSVHPASIIAGAAVGLILPLSVLKAVHARIVNAPSTTQKRSELSDMTFTQFVVHVAKHRPSMLAALAAAGLVSGGLTGYTTNYFMTKTDAPETPESTGTGPTTPPSTETKKPAPGQPNSTTPASTTSSPTQTPKPDATASADQPTDESAKKDSDKKDKDESVLGKLEQAATDVKEGLSNAFDNVVEGAKDLFGASKKSHSASSASVARPNSTQQQGSASTPDLRRKPALKPIEDRKTELRTLVEAEAKKITDAHTIGILTFTLKDINFEGQEYAKFSPVRKNIALVAAHYVLTRENVNMTDISKAAEIAKSHKEAVQKTVLTALKEMKIGKNETAQDAFCRINLTYKMELLDTQVNDALK